MNLLHRLSRAHVRSSSTGLTDRHLHGRRLILARAGCGAGMLLALCLFVAAIPALYAQRSQPSEAIRTALAQFGLSIGFYATYVIALQVVFALAHFVIAVLIVWRKPADEMALFVALFLVLVGTVNAPNMAALAARYPALVALAEMANVLLGAALLLFLFLFPDGRFAPRWTRPVVLIWLVGVLAMILLTRDSIIRDQPDWFGLLFIGGLAAGIGAQIYRYARVSTLVQRQQTKWIVFGVSVGIAGQVVGILLPTSLEQSGRAALPADLTGITIVDCAFLLIPLTIGIAILRYRLWDIDILINRALVYGGLSTCVIGLYVLVVGALGALFQAQGQLLIALIGTGLVAVLVQPLHARLQRAVNRLMYGDRDDPYAVISRLARSLEASVAPDAVLPTIVETVKEALKLPYAAIALKQGDTFVTVAERPDKETPRHGDGEKFDPSLASLSPDLLVSLSLTYQGQMVGKLLLAPRTPGESFSPADRRLLDDLARQAGLAAHAVQLTADLQHSRQRLVSAREEERRRLRRDLHDGLGPTLASLSMKLDAAQTLVLDDPPVGVALLAEVQAELKATLGNVRRLVYALRPPVLDQFGLVGAIREHALRATQGDRLRVAVEAPEQLPLLPAAIEVAAYYIAVAAITNTVVHAHAQHCSIRLTLTDALEVEVIDDGCGILADVHFGVGLHAMRERAAELGGTCVIEAAYPSGTRVLAHLPLTKE